MHRAKSAPSEVPTPAPALSTSTREPASGAREQHHHNQPPTLASPPRLLTIEEAARELRVCRATMFTLLRRSEIGSVRVGRRRLIPAIAIERFIVEQMDGGAA